MRISILPPLIANAILFLLSFGSGHLATGAPGTVDIRAVTPPHPNFAEPDYTLPQLAGRSCGLKVKWTSNWNDGFLHRYRVKATALGGTFVRNYTNSFTMLEQWCDLFDEYAHKNRYRFGVFSPKCWLDDDKVAWADLSTFEGSFARRLMYLRLHEDVIEAWRYDSQFKCNVQTDF